MRKNFSLLGMLVGDTLLLYTGARGRVGTMVQSEFYEALALDLIDNNFEQVGLRKSTATNTRADVLSYSSGFGPHATSTKKRKQTSDGRELSVREQKNYRDSASRTTRVFSQCRDEGNGDVFVCDSSKGRLCFA
jgi:hypothetical protein